MAGNGSIIDDSHDFWDEVVLPLLQVRFPEETAQMAAGFFGYGSEVLRLDDGYSTDHHFGLRVNILLPEAMTVAMPALRREPMTDAIAGASLSQVAVYRPPPRLMLTEAML